MVIAIISIEADIPDRSTIGIGLPITELVTSIPVIPIPIVIIGAPVGTPAVVDNAAGAPPTGIK